MCLMRYGFHRIEQYCNWDRTRDIYSCFLLLVWFNVNHTLLHRELRDYIALDK